jgi:hypothetical protein
MKLVMVSIDWTTVRMTFCVNYRSVTERRWDGDGVYSVNRPLAYGSGGDRYILRTAYFTK